MAAAVAAHGRTSRSPSSARTSYRAVDHEGEVSASKANRQSLADRPSALLAAQNGTDLLEPGRHIPLIAVPGRLVVPGAQQLVRQVLLRGHPELGVVRILVALAVSEASRSRVVRVAQGLG